MLTHRGSSPRLKQKQKKKQNKTQGMIKIPWVSFCCHDLEGIYNTQWQNENRVNQKHGFENFKSIVKQLRGFFLYAIQICFVN